MSRQAFATSRRSYAVGMPLPRSAIRDSFSAGLHCEAPHTRLSSVGGSSSCSAGFTLALRISSEWARSADVCLEAMGAFAPQFENFFFGSVPAACVATAVDYSRESYCPAGHMIRYCNRLGTSPENYSDSPPSFLPDWTLHNDNDALTSMPPSKNNLCLLVSETLGLSVPSLCGSLPPRTHVFDHAVMAMRRPERVKMLAVQCYLWFSEVTAVETVDGVSLVIIKPDDLPERSMKLPEFSVFRVREAV
ncbi:hypothetical protein A0H81_12753 [Grifola frondosa]|uniref:Uncharacterized protein n=1 Tax=Grifola frondosa TaxID=5627 RepID=A0A1C7LRU5_GRIFR|nr:hypothetical protein A0H81_12753 [Grifola frondosa]